MKRKSGTAKVLTGVSVALLAALYFLWPETVYAQCPMCKTAVSGAKMAQSLNLGILVLIIPPVTIFCSIFVVAFKQRQASHMPAERDADESRDDIGLKS